MRLGRLTLAVAAAFLGSAKAQDTPPAERPYPIVTVNLPEAFDEAGFDAFRQALATAARSRIYEELARLTVRQGFFWERDVERRFDPQQPGVDNLAAAIRLESGKGEGWPVLAAFAEEASAAPLPAHPGVVCAPQPPPFDEAEFTRLVRQTWTDAAAWTYPRTDRVALHAAPRPDSAVTETLGRHFIQLAPAAPQAATRRIPGVRHAVGASPHPERNQGLRRTGRSSVARRTTTLLR